MKKLFCLAAMLAATQAIADTSTCYSVADADARAYCLAKARGDTSSCYSIQRADLRSMCLAEVRR